MEQIYFDEIHKCGITGKTIFLKTLLVGACILISPFLFFFGGPLGLPLVAAAIYGVYFLFQKMNREYEYIYTGGEVDIDVIYGMQRRRRMITIKPRQVEFMGKTSRYFEEYSKKKDVQKILDFSDGNKANSYLAIVNSNQLKKLILFSPSERLVEQMKFYLRERFTD